MLKQEQLNEIINLQQGLDLKISEAKNITNYQKQEFLDAKFLALLVEIGEFANEQRCFKYWSLKGASDKEILLEEFIDGFHFIISIANNLELKLSDYKFQYQDKLSLTSLFLYLFDLTLKLQKEKSLVVLHQWMNIYYSIAKLCDFSADDIFNGYCKKNKINHLRQEQNY